MSWIATHQPLTSAQHIKVLHEMSLQGLADPHAFKHSVTWCDDGANGEMCESRGSSCSYLGVCKNGRCLETIL